MSLFSCGKVTDKDPREPQIFFIIFARVIIFRQRVLNVVFGVDGKCHGDNYLLVGEGNRFIVFGKVLLLKAPASLKGVPHGLDPVF